MSPRPIEQDDPATLQALRIAERAQKVATQASERLNQSDAVLDQRRLEALEQTLELQLVLVKATSPGAGLTGKLDDAKHAVIAALANVRQRQREP